MPVGDQHVAALRAFLAMESDYFSGISGRLIKDGDVADYGGLVYAAFVTAVRRRFAPTWTVPQVVRFVGEMRVDLLRDGIDIDPRTAEILVRRALGDGIDVRLEEEASARAQIFLLLVLIDDEGLDDAGLDAFLAQARSLADQLADRAAGEDGGPIPAGGASDGQAPGFDKT